MRTVNKPWGHEKIWAETERYVGKILHIDAAKRLSLQFHRQKDETLLIARGKLLLIVGEQGQPLQEVVLEEGQSFHITPGLLHRMVGMTDCDVVEVSTPELDDVVRIDDDFGRQGTSAP